MDKKEETKSVEEAFADLDEILEKLESQEISLEEAFGAYQQGMKLLKYCNEKVDLVEKKMLQMNGDGTLREF